MGFSRIDVGDLKLNTAPMWTFHNKNWRWKPTPMRDYCLWYVNSGIGEVCCNQTDYNLSQGALILWCPFDLPVLSPDSTQEIRLFCCHFECLALPADLFDLPRPFYINNQNYFVQLAHRCEELWWRDTQDSRLETKRNFLSLLYLIYEEAKSEISIQDDDMDAVESVLKGQFDRAWTLDEIANIASLSRSQLVRRFRARYGQSPLQYLNLARLESSRRMLIETNWSLAEIARACGFSDGAHFSNAFKKQFGMTPLAFRKG